MLARLGNIIYWAACFVAAVVWFVGLSNLWLAEGEDPKARVVAVACVVGGFVIWLAGRAVRYILTGPSK